MNKSTCHSIADLLVPYSDGELSEADADRVAAHLRACGSCREQLQRLDQSLALAQSIWQEAASEATAPRAQVARPRRPRFAVALAPAACLLLLAVAAGYWLVNRDRPGPNTVHVTPPAVEETPIEQTEIAVQEIEDIRRMIAREGRIARLAASAEILAAQPGLEKYKEQAERYLAETYGYKPGNGS